MQQIEWKNFRHPEFLKSLNLSMNDLKFLRLFYNQKNSDFEGLNDHLKAQTLHQQKVEING